MTPSCRTQKIVQALSRSSSAPDGEESGAEGETEQEEQKSWEAETPTDGADSSSGDIPVREAE